MKEFQGVILLSIVLLFNYVYGQSCPEGTSVAQMCVSGTYTAPRVFIDTASYQPDAGNCTCSFTTTSSVLKILTYVAPNYPDCNSAIRLTSSSGNAMRFQCLMSGTYLDTSIYKEGATTFETYGRSYDKNYCLVLEHAGRMEDTVTVTCTGNLNPYADVNTTSPSFMTTPDPYFTETPIPNNRDAHLTVEHFNTTDNSTAVSSQHQTSPWEDTAVNTSDKLQTTFDAPNQNLTTNTITASLPTTTTPLPSTHNPPTSTGYPYIPSNNKMNSVTEATANQSNTTVAPLYFGPGPVIPDASMGIFSEATSFNSSDISNETTTHRFPENNATGFSSSATERSPATAIVSGTYVLNGVGSEQGKTIHNVDASVLDSAGLPLNNATGDDRIIVTTAPTVISGDWAIPDTSYNAMGSKLIKNGETTPTTDTSKSLQVSTDIQIGTGFKKNALNKTSTTENYSLTFATMDARPTETTMNYTTKAVASSILMSGQSSDVLPAKSTNNGVLAYNDTNPNENLNFISTNADQSTAFEAGLSKSNVEPMSIDTALDATNATGYETIVNNTESSPLSTYEAKIVQAKSEPSLPEARFTPEPAGFMLSENNTDFQDLTTFDQTNAFIEPVMANSLSSNPVETANTGFVNPTLEPTGGFVDSIAMRTEPSLDGFGQAMIEPTAATKMPALSLTSPDTINGASVSSISNAFTNEATNQTNPSIVNDVVIPSNVQDAFGTDMFITNNNHVGFGSDVVSANNDSISLANEFSIPESNNLANDTVFPDSLNGVSFIHAGPGQSGSRWLDNDIVTKAQDFTTAKGSLSNDFVTHSNARGSLQNDIVTHSNTGGSLHNDIVTQSNTGGSLQNDIVTHSNTGGSLQNDMVTHSNARGSLQNDIVTHSNTGGSLQNDIVTHSNTGGSLQNDIVTHLNTGGSLQNDIITHSNTGGSLQNDIVTHSNTGGSLQNDIVTLSNTGGSLQNDIVTHSNTGGSLQNDIVTHSNTGGSLQNDIVTHSNTGGSLQNDIVTHSNTGGSLQNDIVTHSNTGGSLQNDIVTHSNTGGSLQNDIVTHSNTGGSLQNDIVTHSNTEGSLQNDMVTHSNTGGSLQNDIVTHSDTGGSLLNDIVTHSNKGGSLQNDIVTHSNTGGSLQNDIVTHSNTGGSLQNDIVTQSNKDNSLQNDIVTHSNTEGSLQNDIVTHSNTEGSLKNDFVTHSNTGGTLQNDFVTHSNAAGSLKNDIVTKSTRQSQDDIVTHSSGTGALSHEILPALVDRNIATELSGYEGVNNQTDILEGYDNSTAALASLFEHVTAMVKSREAQSTTVNPLVTTSKHNEETVSNNVMAASAENNATDGAPVIEETFSKVDIGVNEAVPPNTSVGNGITTPRPTSNNTAVDDGLQSVPTSNSDTIPTDLSPAANVSMVDGGFQWNDTKFNESAWSSYPSYPPMTADGGMGDMPTDGNFPPPEFALPQPTYQPPTDGGFPGFPGFGFDRVGDVNVADGSDASSPGKETNVSFDTGRKSKELIDMNNDSYIIVVGAIAGLVILATIIGIFCRNSRKKRSEKVNISGNGAEPINHQNRAYDGGAADIEQGNHAQNGIAQHPGNQENGGQIVKHE